MSQWLEERWMRQDLQELTKKAGTKMMNSEKLGDTMDCAQTMTRNEDCQPEHVGSEEKRDILNAAFDTLKDLKDEEDSRAHSVSDDEWNRLVTLVWGHRSLTPAEEPPPKKANKYSKRGTPSGGQEASSRR